MPAAEAIAFAVGHPLRRVRDTAAELWAVVTPDPDGEAFRGPIGITEMMREAQPDVESLVDLACLMFAVLAALDALFIAVTVGAARRRSGPAR